MIIGLLTIQINLHGVTSLKGKRGIVKSLVERLRNRFNASVAETAAQDSKRLAVVGVAVISNEGSHLNEQLDKIVNFVANDGRFYVGQIQRETFTSDAEPPHI
ncbi:MAG: DUF503 domain-containing protein [Planctomycetota bacterium]|jgi:uncharacterized protein YlxP (DUF503 family)